jgi:hypothetical protein
MTTTFGLEQAYDSMSSVGVDTNEVDFACAGESDACVFIVVCHADTVSPKA